MRTPPAGSEPPRHDDPADDLPPLDPRAVRRIEDALDAIAGTAHPTEAGWADVARRTDQRRVVHRRTQVAVAAAAAVLLIAGVVVTTGRREAPADLGTVGRPAPPTTVAPPGDRLDTTGTSAVGAPGTSAVVPPVGDAGTAPPSAPPSTTAPPTTAATTTTSSSPPTTVVAGPPVAVVTDPDPLVQCPGSAATFRPSLFAAPGDAEEGTDPLATALRTELARGRFDGYPDSGWRLAWSTDTSALFIAGVPPFARTFTMRFADDRWQASGGGGCAALRVAPPEGVAWATWTIGARPPADTTSFTVFVDDPSCSGTQPVGDRILPPRIDEHDDQVIITITVTPLPPGGATCPTHAATPYTVTLQQPVGERALFDGGTWPARLEPAG